MKFFAFSVRFRSRARSAKQEESVWRACFPYLNKRTGRLLDAGCGAGDMIGRLLVRNDPRITLFGTDISGIEIKNAAGRFADRGCFFVQADACSLPFQEATFDTIVSFHVIEHLKDPKAFLQELARVLVPGGLCLVTTPNLERPINLFRRYVLRRPYRLRWENWKNIPDEEFRGHRQEYTGSALKSLFEENGFTIMATDGIGPGLSFEGSPLQVVYMMGIFSFWLLCRLVNRETSNDIVMVAKKM